MGLEIEKKYRLTHEQGETVARRLIEVGATPKGKEFEENTIYVGNGLDPSKSVLRLRRVGGRAILTYKERFTASDPDSAIRHQREDETRVEDPEALVAILVALGYRLALVYEKRRVKWYLMGTEVSVDELPFGLFMEIEGEEGAIREAERLLDLTEAEAELATYPELTERLGSTKGDVIEARFPNSPERV
jgi:adenylate cyclase class 2